MKRRLALIANKCIKSAKPPFYTEVNKNINWIPCMQGTKISGPPQPMYFSSDYGNYKNIKLTLKASYVKERNEFGYN